MDTEIPALPSAHINDPLPLPNRHGRSYIPWLAVLVGSLLVSTIVLAVLFGLEKRRTTTTTTPQPTTTTTTLADDNICLTPYCVKAANFLLDSIDESINPCEDFYQFSCGTWIKTARIPADSGAIDNDGPLNMQLNLNLIDLISSIPSNGTVELKAITNTRNLYNSCIDEATIELDGVEPILSIIKNEFGGWPILQGASWNVSTFNLSALLIKLRKYDDGIIYSVMTATDQENSSVYDIYLRQGTLGLQEREYYIDNTDITKAYQQFMYNLASALTNDTLTIQTDVSDIYLLEKNISQNTIEITLRENETIRTTIANLSNSFKSNFDFTNHLRQSYLLGNVVLMDSDIVSISTVAYLINISLLLTQTSPRTVQNYLIWRFMMNRVSSMTRQIRSTREQFDRVYQGTSAEASRTITCIKYVNENMGFAISRLYIQKYFDDNARNQSKDLIKNIRSAFIVRLQQADWMDNNSKIKAIDKANAIYDNIAYPDYIASDNTTQLESLYADVRISFIFVMFECLIVLVYTSYIRNVLQMQRVQAEKVFRTLREVVDHRAWSDRPTIVNAFYDPSTNAMYFPAGILQTPYFTKDSPKYLNYGGIGIIAGHEITHGFDDDGRQYDKNGNKIPCWSNSTITEFNIRKQCIVDQYSNYTIAQINKNLNGAQTQGENIADDGGMKSAFLAYQNWAKENPNLDKRLPGLSKYSQEQMFFIVYAYGYCTKFTDAFALHLVLSNVHSIGQFRVNGPVSNFREFDRVFNCTPGQGSSRVNKCAVW